MLDRDAERDRLHALLRSALDRPVQHRDAFLDDACGGDAVLRARLGELMLAVEEVTEHGGASGSYGGGHRSSGADAVADDRSDPPLTRGQRLGRYEILEQLGAGGMGTVYRALDPSLGREVAIKALARAFRGDSGSLRRFEREARVLAALSHPNIASIYGFERLEGSPYLVLERVEGETLAQRIARGPLPLREATIVATQIIEGLEEAHAKGVIHRDLKPSNVMLAGGGRAKLVDFGLAKTSVPRPDAAAMAEPITAAGAVLGTARYMSPEQVHGDEVDTRTDVWAFGCVLYEMLTGRAAFPGRSVPAVLAAVLRDDPDWSALPADVPHDVRRLLRRCLRRDPRTRLQHIGDARIELLEAETGAPPADVPDRWTSVALRWLPWAIAAASVAASAALFLLRPANRVGERRPARLSLDLPANLSLGSDYAAPFAIAPDGRSIVVEAREGSGRHLFLRALADPVLRPLVDTAGARQPFFSPDGAWVAFFNDLKLAKIAAAGGPMLPLADIGGNPRGATWAADGTIIVAPSQTSGLVRVSDQGGRVTPLTTLDAGKGEYSHRWPHALPGGKWILFTVGLEDASFDEARIEAVSLGTGERRLIVSGAGFARYAPSGHLLFVRGGRLYRVGFDAERLAVQGSPDVVLDTVRYNPRNGGCHLDVSASGVLAYTPGVASSPEHYLAWFNRDGTAQRAVDTPRLFRDPRVSPDGRRIAAVVGSSTESDLWMIDANTTLSRLSFGMTPHRPAWTPDGTRVTVGAQQRGNWRLLTLAADGSGAPVELFYSPNRLYPDAWSPDGRRLVFQEHRPDTGWDLRILEVDATGKPSGTPQALAQSPFHETDAALSPDGRWVAYESDEVDGIVQIYARSFPDGAHKILVSTGGARYPAWGPGGELFYWRTGESEMHVVRTRQDGAQLAVASANLVWPREGAKLAADLSRLVVTVAGARYDVHPSGLRFLALEAQTAPVEPAFTRPVVVLDWVRTPASR